MTADEAKTNGRSALRIVLLVVLGIVVFSAAQSTSPRDAAGGVLGFILIIVLVGGAGLLFFLPTIVAVRNPKCPYQGVAIIVNLLLGWTGLFWVVALILAVQGPRAPVVVMQQQPTLVPPTVANWYPDPYRRYEQRYYDGAAWTPTVTSQGVIGTDPL